MLGKLAKRLVPVVHAVPRAANAGDVVYTVGLLVAMLLWGFAIVWFFVAAVMVATSGGFPFNMGWWGFIFPVGQWSFLTPLVGGDGRLIAGKQACSRC